MRDVHVKSMEWGGEFHACDDKVVAIIGGVGSGKSMEGSAWLIEKACEYPLSRLYYMGAAYPAMREGTAVTLCERLEDYGFRYDFVRSSLYITVTSGPARGATFIPTSSEVFRRLKGQMIDFMWADEAQEWCEGSDTAGGLAYDFLLTRLRQSESAQKHYPDLRPQMRLTANPPHQTTHWLYQKFVKRRAAKLFHVTTFDNPLLPQRDEFIETLRTSMSPELFDIEVLGKWGNLGVGTVYTSFDSSRNVSDVAVYDSSLPLIATHDFGVDPRVAVMCQVHPGVIGQQKAVVHVVGEIRIRNGSTVEMIEEFCRMYPAGTVSKLLLYGDPAGQNRNSTTGISDWHLLANDPRMKLYPVEIMRKSSAPLIVDRVNAVNSKLLNARREVGILIHPSCEHLIDDLQHTKWKEGTRQLDHGSPAKGILRTHLSDALGYYIETEWPLGAATFGFGTLGKRR